MAQIPPPPPIMVTQKVPDLIVKPSKTPTLNKELCAWAQNSEELQETCIIYNICHTPPYMIKYRHLQSVLQDGPTCGLVALSMLSNALIATEEVFRIAKDEGFTNNGEIFSCNDMLHLTRKVLSLTGKTGFDVRLEKSGLFENIIVEKLLDDCVLLVPYDSDFNHAPCQKHGHKAHWVLILGTIIISKPVDGTNYTAEPDNIYVLGKHGKSLHLAAWRLDHLHHSNQNLWEFAPKRGEDGLTYVLPSGGLGGENGLRNQFIIINGL